MNFETAYQYLLDACPMFQRAGGEALDFGLDKIKAICAEKGNHQLKFPVLHVAGTNGKGSVSSMLAAILSENYKVGLFTSPHLVSFTERMRINGVNIPPQEMADLTEAYVPIIEAYSPSFFEITTAMAFDYFAQNQVDIAVIEVGMGGRLDSTNIVTPELSIITNISHDHGQFLGDTLAKIAAEKAGIIKPKVPVIIGKSVPETRRVFDRIAKENDARITYAAETIAVTQLSMSPDGQTLNVSQNGALAYEKVFCSLAGNYQLENVATVFTTIHELQKKGWNIPTRAIYSGLGNVQSRSGLQGRMMKIQDTPLVMCDTGHNEAGVSWVMKQLKEFPQEELHIVWGMVGDKSREKILALLPTEAKYYFVCPALPRGLKAEMLQKEANAVGLIGQAYASVKDGYSAALMSAKRDDLIFVGGSTFVVAEIPF